MSIITSNGKGRFGAVPDASNKCSVAGCGGEIVRHSLGCGIGVARCTRCFAKYEASGRTQETSAAPSRFRRLLHEIVTWREVD